MSNKHFRSFSPNWEKQKNKRIFLFWFKLLIINELAINPRVWAYRTHFYSDCFRLIKKIFSLSFCQFKKKCFCCCVLKRKRDGTKQTVWKDKQNVLLHSYYRLEKVLYPKRKRDGTNKQLCKQSKRKDKNFALRGWNLSKLILISPA